MSFSQLLFSSTGRIGRTTFFVSTILVWSVFFNIGYLMEKILGDPFTIALSIPLLWIIFCLSVKRYHDIGKTGKNVLLVLIPVAGPVWVFVELLVRKGMRGSNRYGESPNTEYLDYRIVATGDNPNIVNDVTQINPVKVKDTFAPTSVQEVIDFVKSTKGQISVGGGRFSMGGQVSSAESMHIDMRRLNKIVQFNALEKVIVVQPGVRWCDIQRTIDNQNLSVKIMQTYANFTVGGSLSVNAHGRYMGLGPMILSVRSIKIVLANGELIHATPSEHNEIFYGAIGGYSSLGIIVEATLELAENVKVTRCEKKLTREEYVEYFRNNIRSNHDTVFHNADVYPPHYKRLRAVSWIKTDKPATSQYRLMPVQKSYPIHRYFYWAFSETLTGKWRREFLIEPILYGTRKVHWRNYEAGYDVGELEPSSRKKSTYVLQEYFVPVDKFDEFVPKMAEVLRKHKVNVINVSVRHAYKDPGSYLAWAQTEVFAFVLYYKQHVDQHSREKVGEWTRALINAVLSCDGRYYLPYQPHATAEQFHFAYPRAKQLFELKQKLDPDFRFTNVLWDKYYKPTLKQS
jgi:FAD/FMN-containing dehydrogenase/uncharacterized membrane protein YhaH (DUF805 family)